MTIRLNKALFFYFVYLVFLASVILSLRAVTSIVVGVMLVSAILTKPSPFRYLTRLHSVHLILLFYFLLFLIQLFAVFYTQDQQAGWSNVRLKAGLVLIPLAVVLSSFLNRSSVNRLLFFYSLLLLAATLYCLASSAIHVYHSGTVDGLFYHGLVSPVSQHAIYVSVLVGIALAWLLENNPVNGLLVPKWLRISLVAYFAVFLFLLSSKLVITAFVVYFIFFLRRLLVKRKIAATAALAIITGASIVIISAFTFKNPVSSRFHEIVNGDLAVLRQKTFSPGDYFNGLQFRLLQWRFVGEILTEQNSWITGVSPGDGQRLLNEKFLSVNMYAGEKSRGDRGYLIYNTHNQYLETLLQTGLIGLTLLLAICFLLVKLAWSHRDSTLRAVTLLLLLWLFTEAAFETQYGITIFTFFPLFIASRTIQPGLTRPTF